jgi:hypothetical protein
LTLPTAIGMPPLPQLQHPQSFGTRNQIEHGPSATPQAAGKVGAGNRDGQERIDYTNLPFEELTRDESVTA